MGRLNYPFLAMLVIPIAFTLMVHLARTRPYPQWAKVASLIGCAAGVAWFVITLFQPHLSFSRYPFLWAVSIKQSLSGIFLGIFIAIGIARLFKQAQNDDTPKV